MARMHLFEFEDFPWFPAHLRDLMTDFLHFQSDTFGVFDPAAQKIREVMERTGTRKWVDMCSGGAGPLARLQRKLADDGFAVSVTMTDKYPNVEAFKKIQRDSGGMIGYRTDSVDVTDAPPDMDGMRTIFAAFHHFDRPMATRILQNAADCRAPIGIFELTERTAPIVALAPFLLPAIALATVPFHRPLRLSRLALTYMIPALPFFVAWDGTVSCLRSYSPDELREMTQDVRTHNYQWEIGQTVSWTPPMRMTYLLGWPTEPASQ